MDGSSDIVASTMGGNYMAGATGPVDFGVLQTRQLVNANRDTNAQS